MFFGKDPYMPKQIWTALDIAANAHRGQHRRGGDPYITHPLRVAASAGDDWRAVCVALLHDVVEDTSVELRDLWARGLALEVVTAVDHLTHRKDDVPYDLYVARLAADPLARKVKMLDICDNLSDAPNDEQRGRYREALAALIRAAHEGQPLPLAMPRVDLGNMGVEATDQNGRRRVSRAP